MAQIIKDVNIGEAIKKIMAKKKIYQKDIAEALNFTQPYMNKLLSKQSIATDRLVQISNIIGYNFFMLYSMDQQEQKNMPLEVIAKPEKVDIPLDKASRQKVSENISYAEINKVLMDHNDSLKKEVEHLRELNYELMKQNSELVNSLLQGARMGVITTSGDTPISSQLEKRG